MRNPLLILCAAGLALTGTAGANGHHSLDYDFQLGIERSALDGLSLGDDSSADRMLEWNLEFEFALEYQVGDDFYLFFTGALIDETETVETAIVGENDVDEKVSGLERKTIGLGYFFGEAVDSQLHLGRTEFVSASEWWLWWDEELDAVRLDSAYGDFELTLGLAEELARESTGVDFIDPEFDDVRRLLLSLAWEFADDQSLILYYLDQRDDSRSFDIGEFEDDDRIDEEDADLDWTGISYLGGFDSDALGELEIELHVARVSGDETRYEFDAPSGGRAEVVERERHRVSGRAYGLLLNWTPAVLRDLTLVVGRAAGEGDRDTGDNRLESFRQSGLQGDSESLGQLYQPELSNLVVDVLGLRWRVSAEVELSLLRYVYEQDELADEMRDVRIEFDPNGVNRDLGREVDLVATIATRKGLELVVTAAEFNPGSAYGDRRNQSSNFIMLELDYEF